MNEYRALGTTVDDLQKSIEAGFCMIEKYIAELRSGEINEKLLREFKEECNATWQDLGCMRRIRERKKK